MTTHSKKRALPPGMGGRQTGAGRPAKPPDQRVKRRVVYLSPDLDGWLTDCAGNTPGAVEREIRRILQQHKDDVRIF